MPASKIVLDIAWAIVALVLSIALIYLTLILVEFWQFSRRLNNLGKEIDQRLRSVMRFFDSPLFKWPAAAGQFVRGMKKGRKKTKDEDKEE